jgi:Uma2 family endonuclease
VRTIGIAQDHTWRIAFAALTGARRGAYAAAAMDEGDAATLATRRWTRAEYDRLIELGFLPPGERLELLDGQLAVREPQSERHASAIRRVVRALRPVLGDEWQIDAQLPIALDEMSEPEPDVSIVPRADDDYATAHPMRPLLVIEVADSSYRIDHGYKSALYARAGIRESWLVDLVCERLEMHRDPGRVPGSPLGARYGSVTLAERSATVAPLFAPAVRLQVSDFLPG